jgi:tartrate-resistant acid phosphatase type 5
MMRFVYPAAALLALAAACGGFAATTEVAEIDGGTPEGGADGAADVANETTVDAKADAPTKNDGGDAGDAGADADAAVDPVLVKLAVIGDYGNGSARELMVANLIMSWTPELIITVGDNDYGIPHQYDDWTGQYFHSFIAPYAGAYGAGAVENAFFPAIGNHDWDGDDGAQYFDFFTLPGNERYYEIDRGPLHLVFLDSDPREPDGTDPASTQGAWAQAAIAASPAPFQFVVFHHPAYTSGGRTPAMDWPFKAWGANAVVTGHVHNYERLRSPQGLEYFVVGQGGVSTAGFGPIHPSSSLRYNSKDGAQLVEVGAKHARFRYYDVAGTLVDDVSIDATGALIP